MKRNLYLFFIFLVLLMSWDYSKEGIAIAQSASPIPEEAIRLRIIANSDLPEDQWLKRKVRDLVIEEMNQWVTSLTDIEEARAIINQHLPELESLVYDAMEKYGYHYEKNSKVELGIVPFPTKKYGDFVYPAGDYEALRITLGDGLGQNWWCVLFPPLCFVDISTGDAVDNSSTKAIMEEKAPQQQLEARNSKEDVEVKFFVVELFDKITSFFKSVI